MITKIYTTYKNRKEEKQTEAENIRRRIAAVRAA